MVGLGLGMDFQGVMDSGMMIESLTESLIFLIFKEEKDSKDIDIRDLSSS